MQIQSNGKRNITLDYELPKKFRLSFNGVDVPYLRTGKNSLRLSKDINGLLDVEELKEEPQKIVRPMQLQPQQMALVNPADVIAINQAAQQLEIEQNILNENQKRFENAQNYINIQQEQINQAIVAVNDLETNNEQRISKNEQSIFNLAGEIARVDEDATNNSVSIISELESHKTADNPHNITKKTINLENVDNTADIDKPLSKAMEQALNEKADKDEIEQIREEIADYQTKTERFNDAIANYTGGIGGNELPIGGFTGQVLAKKSDISGDYEWIDSAVSVGEGILTIQKNGTDIDTFSANAKTDKTINILVPTQASDINAMPDSVKYGSSLSLTIDNSTFVVTAQLKDQDNNNLGSSQTIDLPLESVVVNGSYDSDTKKVILTLQNGNTIEFSVADLVAGLQSEITASNKLDADLVDDSGSTNKFVSASEKNLINSALQPNDNISELVNDSGFLTRADLPQALTTNIADVVGTYAELQAYNTSTLPVKSIVEVLEDANNSNKHSYYRWVSSGSGGAFVQPILSADGTIGGDSFAVAMSSVYSGRPAWHAFDGVKTLNPQWTNVAHTGNSMPAWFEFYNPVPICVTKMAVTNGNINPVNYQFQASSDGTTWITLVDGVNQYATPEADWRGYTWEFDVPNTNYYKYYRFYVTSGTYLQYCSILEFEITATEEFSAEWQLVDDEGPFVPTSRTINSKTLSSNITLTASDVGAYPDNNPSGFITGISSSDVTAALGYTPANDSNVVKTSGDQSVGGFKTFTKQVTKTNNSAGADTIFVNKNTAITKGTAPSASVESRWRLTDSSTGDGNSALIGGVTFGYATSMRTSAILQAGKPEAGSTSTASLGIYYPATGDPYTSAPTPATSDNSTKIATTAYVKAQGYALDSNVVKTSGNQTIDGGKTLTDNLNIQKGAPNIYLKDTSITKGTTPSSIHYSWYGTIYDSQGINQANKMSQIYTQYNTNGSHSLNMSVFKPESGSTTSSTLVIGYDSNGNVYTSAPTPATSNNSSNIATTAFVNNWVNANTSEVAVVVESWRSGTEWYKIWSNGVIEQGGWKSGFSSANTFENVTLHKPFADTYYNVQVSGGGPATTIYNYKIGNSATNTTTAFKLLASNTGAACFWYACGQGA